MTIRLLLLLLAGCVLAGCSGLPHRCDTSPCWYDESKGPGAPYYDPNEPDPTKRYYYLGKDPLDLRRVIRIYPSTGTVPPNPYIYWPCPNSYMSLYRWSIIRPYVFPKK